jgi:hypothetical protein
LPGKLPLDNDERTAEQPKEQQKKGTDAMKEPRGIDLLKTLIDLLADQENVKITYELETKEKTA